MATVVKSFAIQGVDGYTVDIESKVLDGQPMISIIGMGDVAVKEAGDRIQSAIDESGYVSWKTGRTGTIRRIVFQSGASLYKNIAVCNSCS